MSLTDAYNSRRVRPETRPKRTILVALDIPGDRDTVEIQLDGAPPPYIDTAALLLSWAEACELHTKLGEFLRAESEKLLDRSDRSA